jgi:lipid-A-disaccharide synthase
LALLPFEPPYFTREGLDCTFVGHSLIESGAGNGDGARFRAARGIASNAPLLAVLPGSRMSEVRRLLPIFYETVVLLKASFPDLQVVVPLASGVAPFIRKEVADWPVTVHFTEDDAAKYDALAAAKAALACSGTISIELAMARLPSVIAYKINALTAALYRRLIKLKYATLVNIMMDREVMPEYIQEKCEPAKLAEAVSRLMRDEAARATQTAVLGALAEWLGEGSFVPSERAAEVVLSVVEKGKPAC